MSGLGGLLVSNSDSIMSQLYDTYIRGVDQADSQRQSVRQACMEACRQQVSQIETRFIVCGINFSTK